MLLVSVCATNVLRAAEIENDRLRHIRLHERVSVLPDLNYATLKYILGRLHKCVRPGYR